MMGELIRFRPKEKHDPTTIKLVNASLEIDGILLKYLEEGVDDRELLGMLAHRLGSFLKSVESKEELWMVCERVLKRQARISS